ncbi:enoyl-CoA hydratase [Rhodothalassium salexigens]|uniref:enoyl-CoA hydratase/isomerase family protein n=1 Tax=Rhodothalassium salexigens TaxID=1086 RepID=UPI0019113EE4|nr:enoyl-CoA hydratase-related protein [Rhodothalassium salexigens]MBK5920637.1 enoyl-CoA hydratase [Rhodothalassium salexigens]
MALGRDYQRLRFDRAGRVLTVTIDTPGAMNPVDGRLHHELAALFPDLGADADSDVVVLTGAEPGFCAGGDMAWFQSMIDEPARFRAIAADAKRIILGALEMEKPLVCRMNGPAAGLGASLALLCDIIVADETASIGDPHVKMGLVAGDGGAVLWPQIIGYPRAKELLLTGDMVAAPRAAEIGLINDAVPAAALDHRVDALTAKLVGGARWAQRWTKAAINLPLRDLANRISEAAIAYEMITQASPDHGEAVAAFGDRRPPRFTGG